VGSTNRSRLRGVLRRHYASPYSLLFPQLSTVNRALTCVHSYEEKDGCYSYEYFCTTSPKEIWRKIPYNLRPMKPFC